MSTIYKGNVYTKKDKGKIDEVDEKLNFDNLPGNIGIAHTRWATHGGATKVNAHPHHCSSNKIAVVHNGIIENYLDLRQELEEEYGHKFISECDTEVIPHLIEIYLQNGKNRLREAVKKALKKIKGSYALAILYKNNPNQIILAKKESPLVIGLAPNASYAASDIPAFLPLTNRVIILEDGEFAVLNYNNVEIYKTENHNTIISRDPQIINWNSEMAEKGGMPHFMLKEIHEQPRAISNTLRINNSKYLPFVKLLNDAKNIFITAAGTSFHAGLASSYTFNKISKLHNNPIISSEFIDKVGGIIDNESVVLAISQSGETMDTLNAINYAKKKGAKILSITNVMGSSIIRMSDHKIITQAGPEIGVAATKTFLVQLICLTQLSLYLAEMRGLLNSSEIKFLKQNLMNIPKIIQKIIVNQEENIKIIAQHFANNSNFLFLGRGISSITAAEGALKLKEISYIHAESYPAGECKHGPIALIERDFPVVFIAPPDDTQTLLISNIMEMKARNAKIITVSQENDYKIHRISNAKFIIPSKIPEILTPIAYIVPLQIFAYFSAIFRGNDPDKPRNLAKTVTVL